MDPLAHIAAHPTIASLIDAAAADLQALHRHPATARGSGVTSSEGVLRGARLAALLGNAPETQLVDAYSVLAPDVREQTARTFTKAPLQVLARLDVLVGGSGRPRDGRAAGRLALLGKIVATNPHQAVIPAVVQGEIIAHELFGPRSMAVGLARWPAVLTRGGWRCRRCTITGTGRSCWPWGRGLRSRPGWCRLWPIIWRRCAPGWWRRGGLRMRHSSRVSVALPVGVVKRRGGVCGTTTRFRR